MSFFSDPPSFTAKYEGECSTCGGDIEPGQRAYFSRNGSREVAHVECPPESAEPWPAERDGKVCPVCWMTSCDCTDAEKERAR